MKTVFVSSNPLDSQSYERHECEDICAFLYDYFEGKKPETLHIFHGQPSQATDVTPKTEADIQALSEMGGPFYAIEMPGDPGTALLIGAVIIGSVAVGVGLAMLSQPPVPTQRSANFQQPSPNNELSQRENRPRIGQRIEDIFGTVRSTPSLLTVPFKIFENNVEKEIAYMCIGKGEYDVSDVRDGDTLISSIDGASVEIYEPFTSPNGGYPVQTIGDPIGREVVSVTRTAAINGQTAEAPNSAEVVGNNDIFFDANSDFLIRTNNTDIDFREYFEAGDSVTVSNAATYTDGTNTYNMNGTSTVDSVFSNYIVLQVSGAQGDWLQLAINGPVTNTGNAKVRNSNSKSIGPFALTDPDRTAIYVNYVALIGLYKTDGANQFAQDVTIQATVTKLDSAGNPTGSPEVFNTTLTGSNTRRESIGVTAVYEPTFTGPCQIAFLRSTSSDREEGFTTQDEVKIRDCYAVSPVAETDFGDVTTILSQTEATEGALAVKERKLNCLVRRLIPKRNANGTFTANQTDYNARDVLIFVARDDRIGNRSDDEIDFQNIADAIDENIAYFGNSDGVEFNYTFDNDNISFEETWRTIAETVFCEPYRVGNLLRLKFEKQHDNPRLLFNHRNIVPDSQRMTVRFGKALNYDGVVFEYVNPDDDSVASIELPANVTVVNPRRIESVGVRNFNQAWWHANRAWNKIQYQNTNTEMEVLEQGHTLIRLDQVLVSDTTRADTSDGEVLAQDGLTLTLSQPHTFLSGVDYSIYLQYADGTVELIDIAPGSTDYEVVLQTSPSGTIITTDAKVQKTPYIIVGNTDDRVYSFLVDEIDPQGNEENTVMLRAINYDSRYYANDGEVFSG